MSSCGDSIMGIENDLAAAQEKWRQDKPANYNMTLVRTCVCFPGASGSVEIVVREGVVISRYYTSNGMSVFTDFYAVFPHVDGLFEKIKSAILAHVGKIEVNYDDSLGYPTSIYIDSDKGKDGDEFRYTVTKFELK